MVISPKLFSTPVLIILSFFVFSQNGFSFSIVRGSVSANKTETKAPDYLKASVFVKLSAREFAAITGKKLNIFQKLYFRIIQREVKRDLKKNPDLLVTDYLDPKTGKFKLSALWFVIGAFIGPFGVLLAYTSHHRKQDLITRKDKITSAWLGFLLFIVWFGFLFVF